MAAYGQLNDASGTVGASATQALAGNTALRYFLIVNQSAAVMYVDFGQTATAASIPLKGCSVAGDGSGGSLEFCEAFMPSGAVSVLGSTSGQAYTIKWG